MESTPFTDVEKRFVLAEIIKNSSVPVDRLFQQLSPLVADSSLTPVWHQILLPHGRNLQSCMDAFENLRQPSQLPTFQAFNTIHAYAPPQAPPVPRPSTKRKPAPDSSESVQGGSKRRQSDMTQHILPKPTSGSPSSTVSPSAAASAEPKKRGRPTKATLEKRQAEAILRGEVIAPSNASTLRAEAHMGGCGERISTPGYPAIAPMVSPRPQPLPTTPATFEQAGGMEAESSGKKRRPKATPKSSRGPKSGESSFSIKNIVEPENPGPAPPASSATVPITQPGPVQNSPKNSPQPAQTIRSQVPPPAAQPPPT